MKLYTNARLIAVEENNFADKEGQNVNYFTCFLKDDSGAVVKVNSGKSNFSEYEGDSGVVELELRERDGKWIPKVSGFFPDQKVEAPEGAIH